MTGIEIIFLSCLSGLSSDAVCFQMTVFKDMGFSYLLTSPLVVPECVQIPTELALALLVSAGRACIWTDTKICGT